RRRSRLGGGKSLSRHAEGRRRGRLQKTVSGHFASSMFQIHESIFWLPEPVGMLISRLIFFSFFGLQRADPAANRRRAASDRGRYISRRQRLAVSPASDAAGRHADEPRGTV